MGLILWTQLFLEVQGIEVQHNILYQDSKSAILLENNGKKSPSKPTRAMKLVKVIWKLNIVLIL